MNADNLLSLYPFCAVVGQERAKKALLLHAVNPAVKGVLLTGATGTSKTTLVRGFAALLPERKEISIPLHVDEDRLYGGLEIAAAISAGKRTFASGLLAAADGQLVRIDDVNLMSERTLHAIMSASEQGGLDMAHEGAAAWQRSSFLLLGTMNPEEAKLNAALLDRWGLYVRMDTSGDPLERAEIVRRRLAFERAPQAFVDSFEPESAALRERLAQAREKLGTVQMGEQQLRLSAEIAREAGCSGQRGDILLAELARTLAAWEGEPEVRAEHVQEAAEFVLPHRLHALDSAGSQEAPQEEALREEAPQEEADRRQGPAEPPLSGREEPSSAAPKKERQSDGSALPEERSGEDRTAAPELVSEPVLGDAAAGEGSASGEGADAKSTARAIVEAVGRDFGVKRISFTPPQTRFKAKAGKRNRASEGGRTGRYARSEAPRGGVVSDLALDATLRAAAPYQHVRRLQQTAEGGPRVRVERSDLRVKVRESRSGTALLFVVDASGSINAAKRMKAVKGAVLSLLRDAYRQRDSVGLVSFRDRGAELLLDITRSVELAERRLQSMPVGGRTPLLAGLEKGAETIWAMQRKGSGLIPAMIIMTDGKANAGTAPGQDLWQEIRSAGRRIAASGIQALVIDTEQGFISLGYARRLAACMQAQYLRLEELDAGFIERAARNWVQEQKNVKGEMRG